MTFIKDSVLGQCVPIQLSSPHARPVPTVRATTAHSAFFNYAIVLCNFFLLCIFDFNNFFKHDGTHFLKKERFILSQLIRGGYMLSDLVVEFDC